MQRLFFIALCLSLLLITGVVTACGGFFCTNAPIDQSAERIIFTINGDDTITTIVGINYEGPAEEFSWIVPVPSVPELDVTEASLLDSLEIISRPNIVSPLNFCDHLYYNEGAGGGGFYSNDSFKTGSVGPYDFVILQSVSTSEIVNWLRDNSYLVTDEMIPLIDVYVREGMYFVALRLSKDSSVGDIQPIVMTYKSVKPMIPIRLTAVAAIPDMPILTWIFADTQYVPENFTHGKVDFSTFRTTNRSQYVGQIYSFIADGILDPELGIVDINSVQYWDARDAIQQEHDGLAFITEYAMPSQDILESPEWDNTSNPDLTALLNTYPYVTRLRAQMSPSQMTLDPTFIPAPDEPNHPALVSLDDHIDPLHYFGCSTREALDETLADNLPAGHTRIDSLNTTIAHPEDWILSEFTFEGKDVWIFSPEVVSVDDIYDVFSQADDTPPMFALLNIAQREDLICTGIYNRVKERQLWDAFNINYSTGLPLVDGVRTKIFSEWFNDGGSKDAQFPGITRVEPFSYDCVTHQGYTAYVLAGAEDWESNADMYWAMLDFAQSAHYETHPDLYETLIVGSWSLPIEGDRVSSVAIGFAEDMIEQWVGDGTISITSETDNLSIELIPLWQHRESTDSFPIEMVETILSDYNVDESARPDLLEAIEPYTAQTENPVLHNTFVQPDKPICLPELPSVRFEADGTYGYLRFEYDWLVVVKTTIGSSIREAMLMTIADSMRDPVLSCEELQRRQNQVEEIINNIDN